MRTPPLVSIIIPCYRQSHFLPVAIDSATGQSYPEVQTIVVNDGSDDNTDEVAGGYGDLITYVRKANGGLPSARNAGVQAARGEYLLFLDSDDAIGRDAVRSLVAASTGKQNVIARMGYRCFWKSIDDAGPPVVPKDEPLLPTLIHANAGPPHIHLVPRQAVLDAGLFRTELRSCEDWDLWLRLAARGADLVTVAYAGAFYRKHQGSMSTNSARMLTTRARVLLDFSHSLLDTTEPDPECMNACGIAMQRVRRRCLVQNAPPELIDELSQTLRHLERLGHAPRRSFLMRQLDRLPGAVGERLALRYLKMSEPGYHQYYANGYD